MRKLILGVLVLTSMPLIARAQQVQTGNAYGFGVGLLPCSEWTASRDVEFTTWIEGYWSGANAMSAAIGSTGLVGQSIGAKSAVEAVRTLCKASPSNKVALEVSLEWVAARAADQ